MVEVSFTRNGRLIKWYIRPLLKQNLDIALHNVKYDEMDLVIVLDGAEGWGKSFSARGLGAYCAHFLNGNAGTFGVNDVSFGTEEYVKGSNDYLLPMEMRDKNEPVMYKVNVLDEGRNALFNRRSQSKSNVDFTNYMSEARFKQQVHIILAPAYFELDRYLVTWRMQLLVSLEKQYKQANNDVGVQMQRGVYKLYIDERKDKKVIRSAYERKTYPHQYVEHDVWSSVEVFTDEELRAYNDKKNACSKIKYGVEDKPEENKVQESIKHDKKYISITQVIKEYGICRETVYNWINLKRVEAKQLGRLWFISVDSLQGVSNVARRNVSPTKDNNRTTTSTKTV